MADRNSRGRPQNWCSTCCEECHQHPSICTMCGDQLLFRPSAYSESSSSSSRPSARRIPTITSHENEMDNANSLSVIDPQLILHMLDSNRTQQSVANYGSNINELLWQVPSPEAMNPNAQQTTSRPASIECVRRIPRIKVEEHSAILFEATVRLLLPPEPLPRSSAESDPLDGQNNSFLLRRKEILFDAVVAEFAPYPPFEIVGTLGFGGTGINGASSIPSLIRSNTIIYMDRGDGITFVQKAMLAQKAGASAVICGNSEPIWPYIMKDTRNEAKKLGLKIPIVMIKRSDGAHVRKLLLACSNCDDSSRGIDSGFIRACISARLASDDANDCVVCREPFAIGDIVMRLPFCAHAFHETCALSWLGQHNTCPFCRRELPTDDPKYEADRRRLQRTHAGSCDTELRQNESQWESIFG